MDDILLEIYTGLSGSRDFVTSMALSMMRLSAAFLIVPFLPQNLITGVMRAVFLFSLALILNPLIFPTMNAPAIIANNLLIAILVKEAVIGILIGFLTGMIYWAAESVGNLIDNQRGATMGEVFAPLTGSQAAPIAILISQALIVLFFNIGGFLFFLGCLFDSYKIWPIMTFWPTFTSNFPVFILNSMDDMFSLIMVISSPIVVTLFLSTFSLGLINRFAPQLNVFFVSLPINSALAEFILLLYMPFMMYLFTKHFHDAYNIIIFLKGVMH